MPVQSAEYNSISDKIHYDIFTKFILIIFNTVSTENQYAYSNLYERRQK